MNRKTLDIGYRNKETGKFADPGPLNQTKKLKEHGKKMRIDLEL